MNCDLTTFNRYSQYYFTTSAFCNTSGGGVVFGIKQKGKRFEVQGVNNGEKTESDKRKAVSQW